MTIKKRQIAPLNEHSAKKKADTRNKMLEKIAELEQEVKIRSKKFMPMGELPTSISEFTRWAGMGSSKSTIYQPHNEDLKRRIADAIKIIKDPPIKKSVEENYKSQINDLNQRLRILAGENAELEERVKGLEEDLMSADNRIAELEEDHSV